MRAPSSLLLPLFTIMACEPMDKPGSPWEPVQMVPQVADEAGNDAAPEIEVDPMFAVPEPIVIHSSELGRSSDQPEDAPQAEEADPAAATDEPAVIVEETTLEPEPVLVARQRAEQAFGLAPAATSNWPLRLVATVPGAQPPRAILGLPGGQEVVVSPGTMLPEAGEVVMAVGSGTVDLAEIKAAGDHAVVQGRTLQAQRTQRVELATP